MVRSEGPAEAPTRARPREWPVIVLLFGCAAAIRALRFWAVIPWPSADQVRVAVPALQILGGTFPVHHVGIEYHGAAVAYPLAAWFAVVGGSPIALDLFCYAVGLGFVWSGFALARRLLPPGAAVATLAVLAVPPLLLAYWAIHGNLNYPVVMVIGNLLLLGTHTVFFRRPEAAAPLLGLGFLAGIGWWGNPLVVVYCVPFGLLALRTGLVWRARVWLFPLGLALGGLPDWIYEALYYPTMRLMVHQSGSVTVQPVANRAAQLFGDIALQVFGGTDVEELATPGPAAVALVALGALVIARAVVRDRAGLRWLVGAGGSPGGGLVLLWGLFAANLLAVLATKRALGPAYLLPLYGVLPIWTGECLWWLRQRRRWLGSGLLATLLAFHLWANWAVTLGRAPGATLRWASRLETVGPLIDWLAARGIRHVYWAGDAGFPAFEFTYLAWGRVTAAHIWAESVIQHAHAVDAAAATPIVTTSGTLPELRASLRALSLDLTETAIDHFVVIEAAPLRPMAFVSIPPDGWTLSASHRTFDAAYLADRDAGTGWSVGNRQEPGQWLAVDLGRETSVARVDLLAVDWQEVPAAFRVEWSRDGARWETALTAPRYWGPMFWSERHAFLKIRRGRVGAIFEPVRARYLRLAQEGYSTHAWAARELFVYGPAPASAMPLRDGEVAAALRREGIRFVYTSAWLSARARSESGESIGALESTSTVNSYGRAIPEATLLERFRFQPDRGILLGADADATEIRRTLAAREGLTREAMVGPYPLLVLKAEPSRPRLARDRWRGRASVAPEAAARAVDGDPRTRWTAGGPVEPETNFTLDLDRPRRLIGIGLTPGSREGGPADFVLDGSIDGTVWQPLAPRTWTGPLFWTGAELLRNSRPEWAVTFPPATARYVRIRPAAPAPTWSIAEIEAFESP